MTDARQPWLVKHLGELAARIVQDEAWREAVRRSEDAIAAAMLATAPADDAARRELHAEYRALRRLAGQLAAIVGDGAQAAARERRTRAHRTMDVAGPAN